MSKSTKARRPQLSRAEIKAYEARRASERRLIVATTTGDTTATPPTRRSYALSRDEEYAVIRGDLRRLLMILAVLAIVLVISTIFLR